MRNILLTLVLAGALSGCAGQPPSAHYYLLRPDAPIETRQLDFEGGIYLQEIKVASYIDQPGLVLYQDDGKVHEARYHLWAEPLHLSLRQFLAAEIASQLGRDVSVEKLPEEGTEPVAIRIDQLHGSENGDVVLVAYWQVGSGERLASYQFASRTAQTRDGYGALVEAEKSLLVQLSRAIADTLKEQHAL